MDLATNAGTEPVLTLSAARSAARADFGSKAANLALMAGLGLPVPPAFCVSAAAYEDHLRTNGILGDLDSAVSAARTATSDERRRLLERLRERIVDAPLPAALSRRIEFATGELGAGRMAVRSSATMEDLAGHSFAGLYDTLLGVSGPADLLKAIRLCWSSLWTERAFDYRERNGFDHRRARMAIVVQGMIDSECSGVLFTADPISGRKDRLLIEAVYGLGEGLVSGKVSPDRIVLARADLRVVEYIVSEKSLEIDSDAHGSRERKVDPVRAKAPCLQDETARQLGALALRAEAAFGGPQDIEWALSGGNVFILQSRPITTLAAPPSDDDRQIWSNLNAGEVVPDVVTPMTWSFIGSAIERIFGTLLGRLGFRLEGHPLLGLVAGRAYFNLNTFVGIMQTLPGFSSMDPIEMWGGKAGAGPHVPPEDVPRFDFHWGPFIAGIPSLLLWFLSHSTHRGLFYATALRRRVKRMEAEDAAGLGEEALTGKVQAMLAQADLEIGDAVAFAGTGSMYQMSLMTLCRQWFGDKDGSVAHRLLAGQGNMESAEAGLAQWRLAVLAHGNPDVWRTLLEAGDFARAAEKLRGADGGREFLTAWEAFMDRHGHHARGEIELANPRWRETPDSVLATIRGFLEAIGTIDPLATHRQSGLERRRLADDYRRRLRNPVKRLIFTFMLGNAQRGCLVRENVKSEAVRWIARIRTLIRELGDRLFRRGVLDCGEDVFFLRTDELEVVCAGKSVFDVRRTIASRKAEYERNVQLQPPQVVVGKFDPDNFVPDKVDADARVLTGVAVSAGVATGPARVVLRSDDDVQVLPGEILVAPFTDPGWRPYFLRAAAIVMDQGGLLSHGSIIAREYGIPAVVNVGPATKIIRTGQLLCVDGGRGRVTLIGDEPSPVETGKP